MESKLVARNWKISLLNYNCSVKLVVEVVVKYKMTENNKSMIYKKEITMKMNKYIGDKSERKYKRL